LRFRVTPQVTRYAGRVSEPEEIARLRLGQGISTLTPRRWGVEGPIRARLISRHNEYGLHSVTGPRMSSRETDHLRVLIANERKDRLALVAPIVAALGHEVIAREIDVEDVGAVTARERPDVALVGLGESSEHALHLVEKIVHEAACPVIALIHAPDPEFVKEASKRGVFAYITDADAKDWQSSIDIVLRRFAEYHDLEGAFGRRAITERAKGILMERHSIDEPTAFDMLREHSRSTNRKVVDVASAVVDGHRLLPKQPHPPAPIHGAGG
jgi:AmiR/NasT family two-component response regulator